jgi:two-component sensor histidine kinase
MAAAVIFTSDTPEAGGVARVRHALAGHVQAYALAAETLDRALLVVSELVTNSIQHARSAYAVAVEPVDPGGIRIEVFDRDTRLPTPVAADADALGGRGLSIVADLATQWGSGTEEREGIRGKVVWAELHPEP